MRWADICIRNAVPQDAAALSDIFHDAIRTGARRDYSERECAAWSPSPPDPDLWWCRIAPLRTWVAEAGGTPVGFMSLRDDGYLDLAFVRPEWQGRGAAYALYRALEAATREAAMGRLETDASRCARRFFLRQGWKEGEAREVIRCGVALENFRMCKSLQPQAISSGG